VKEGEELRKSTEPTCRRSGKNEEVLESRCKLLKRNEDLRRKPGSGLGGKKARPADGNEGGEGT